MTLLSKMNYCRWLEPTLYFQVPGSSPVTSGEEVGDGAAEGQPHMVVDGETGKK